MDDLNSGIRRIAEELRAVREQLQQAGLLAEEDDGRLHHWELARRIGALVERLQDYLFLHHQATGHMPRHASLHEPRPD